MTIQLVVQLENPEPEVIARAAAEIRRGGLVAFPTETVYGLGANALDATAVARIFEAKGRPATDPLIVHLTSAADLNRVARDVPRIAEPLTRTFWPGPLTLVLNRQDIVPDGVTAGLPTVAVRVPAHPVAQALLRQSGVPIAAPSANRFGHTSPTTAQHVLADLDGLIDLILDGGPTTIGIESTVLDVTRTPPIILRPGGVTREALENLVGPVGVHRMEVMQRSAQVEEPSPSPGLLEKHYAPRAELVLVGLKRNRPQQFTVLCEHMARLAYLNASLGRSVGLLLADEDLTYFRDVPAHIVSLGSSHDLTQIARNLYAGLRTLDDHGVDVILVRDFGEQGLGLAIRDRLKRAAIFVDLL
jgi:L-threonylcarbamoyladenylate synthase